MGIKTLFITGGDYNWGSSRIRAFWPCPYMDNAKVLPIQDILNNGSKFPRAENYIWQKTADTVTMRMVKDMGLKNYVDFCDPAWWNDPNYIKEVCDIANGLIFGTDALYDDFVDEYGDGYRHVIAPDGYEPKYYPVQREHIDTVPIRLVWFGLALNRFAILSAVPFIERLVANNYRISLTIYDNEPSKLFMDMPCPVYQTKFDPIKDNEIIASHDIAVLPPYPGKWGSLKSINRIITASVSGLPIVYGDDYRELERLVKSAEYRREKTIIPPKEWESEHSAKILEAFLCE